MNELGKSRWKGQNGRLEVWYATFTDPATGDGFWTHVELLAHVDKPAEVHGWAAHFPKGGEPVCERFGPVPAEQCRRDDQVWIEAGDVRISSDGDQHRLVGSAGSIRWDLGCRDDARPMYTFPKWTWEREVLPGCQIVPWPTATFSGTFAVGSKEMRLEAARGEHARIYSHGNAAKWVWLHADLGGGDAIEVVAGQSKVTPFSALGLVPFVQLRVDGRDWPRRPLLAGMRFKAEVGGTHWSVSGRWRGRRIRIDVDVPPQRSVSLGYTDPDGETATCTNSERADARIVVERRVGREWRVERQWTLDGCAHAEIGTRP